MDLPMSPSVRLSMCDAHDSRTREALMMKGARDLQGDGGSAPDFDEPTMRPNAAIGETNRGCLIQFRSSGWQPGRQWAHVHKYSRSTLLLQIVICAVQEIKCEFLLKERAGF